MTTNPLKDKRVLIADHGLFSWLACKLAPLCGWLGYYTPWEGAFPHPSDVAIGDGLEGVERVNSFWDEVDTCDLIIFPDVGHSDLQDFLRSRGHRVWGSGGGQWLELDRTSTHEHAKSLGIRRPATERVVGIDALRDLIEHTEDRWVKVSLFRGAFETTHHTVPFVTEQWLKVIAEQLGPQAAHLEFVVEKGVPGVEVGWDAHAIDGQYPELGFCGIEVKDKAIVGKMVPFDALPSKMRDVYAKLAPALKEGQYRNYFSVEMRIPKEGADPYLIDPCLRFGSPCSEAWAELCANFAEILWEGAGGRLVQVEPAARYAALAVINSEWAVQHWTPIDVPEEVRPYVRMKCLTEIDGDWYYVPGDLEMSEIGVVVGTGNTLQEAVELVKERAKQIQGYRIWIQTDALESGAAAMGEAVAVGLPVG
jgi:hypothetical protein